MKTTLRLPNKQLPNLKKQLQNYKLLSPSEIDTIYSRILLQESPQYFTIPSYSFNTYLVPLNELSAAAFLTTILRFPLGLDRNQADLYTWIQLDVNDPQSFTHDNGEVIEYPFNIRETKFHTILSPLINNYIDILEHLEGKIIEPDDKTVNLHHFLQYGLTLESIHTNIRRHIQHLQSSVGISNVKGLIHSIINTKIKGL